jgi:hypothetical protein
MIVCYFNVMSVPVFPEKADPPLIVDPDAELTFAIGLQRFQPVARRNSEVIKAPGPVKIQEFPPCNPFYRSEP